MANEHIPVTGGCLCGAVRFESKDPPTEGFYCHCRNCQRQFGGLFGAYVRVPRSSFTFTKGGPRYYRSSAVARRGFCAACGSPLVFVFDGEDANADYWISIGTLDHPEDWPMTKDASWGQTTHGFADRKIPWHEIEDGLPQRTSRNPLLREQAEAALAGKPR
jgi:hypothetical protein